MASYMVWFILSLVLLGLEMMSGTFYLLVIAVALAVGGVASFFAMGFAVQVVASALVGVAGVIVLQHWKAGRKQDEENQNLDIGQVVRVVSKGVGGKLRVHYRGTEWDAEMDPDDAVHEGVLYIKAMRGSVLIVTPGKPQ